MSGKYNGTCSTNTSQIEYYPTYVQFPGELCDPNRAFYECGFGYRKCLVSRCYGYLTGESCASSADCNPHLYCDLQNTFTCMSAIQSGGVCLSNDMCDMGMRCKFDSLGAPTGTCTKYFSLATTSPVYAASPQDLQMCTDGFGFLDSNKLKLISFSSYSWGGRLENLLDGAIPMR